MKNFNSFQPRSSGVAKRLFTLAFGLVLMPLIVWATHFQYGSISWTKTTGNTVVFKVSQAWRLSEFGNPAIGATVNTGTFDFGDATFPASITLTVTSYNAEEDWFYGEATLTHTYGSPGIYTAFANNCCRINTLENNGDGNWRNQTTVYVFNGMSSPVSTITPIVDVPVNNAAYMFTIPAVDPDGNRMFFRFSNPEEAGPGFVQPDGLSINGSTGQMTFNTVGKSIGELYSTQVMITDGRAEVPLDFIIRISGVVGTPPFFVYPPTPPDGTVFTVNAGQTSSFTLQAADNDAGNNVTLSVAGAPVGFTFTPRLPTRDNPVSSVFSWTTTPANIGSYVLSFNAQDNTLQSASTSVTINVIQACNLSLSASITNVSCNSGNDGGIDLTISGAAGTPVILWSNNASTEDLSSLTAGTYSVTVTDENGCEITASYNVTAPTTALTSSVTVSTNVSCAGGSDGSAVVSAEGGTAPYQYTVGSTTNASGIFTGLPAGSFNYTVTDAKGCTSTGSFSISEPTALTCSISVSPNPTLAGQATNTIFLGYGPQSLNLTGSGGTGSYTYDWGSAGSGASVSVSPTVTTTYTLTVTDEKGCKSTCNVTICVVDIRVPGTNGKNVYLCHVPPGNIGNPQTMSVSINAVSTHLSEHSGDRLGQCRLVIPCNTTALLSSSAAKTSKVGMDQIINRSLEIQAFPNPAKRNFNIRLNGVTSTERISLQVVDAQGRLVEKRDNIIANQILQIGNNYKPGSYFIKVTQGGKTKTLSVIKAPN
jgi:hypothetical protein